MRNYAIAGTFSSGKGGTVTVDNELSPTSVNPVQNKVITSKITELEGKIKENSSNGKSAYEIAVAEGFEGTEKEWLESLKGEMGPEGPQGPKGDTGSIGPQGPQGEYAAIDAELSGDSNNPVANRAIAAKIAELEAKIEENSGSGGGLGEYVTGSYSGTDSYAFECDNSSNTKYYEKWNVSVGPSGSSSSITSEQKPTVQEITLGFKPSFILIDGEFYSSTDAVQKYYYKTRTNTVNGTAQTPTTGCVFVTAVEFTDTGFKVLLNLNFKGTYNSTTKVYEGGTHYYTAFK